jgi:glycerol-3-phosphate cytidylyltransferase
VAKTVLTYGTFDLFHIGHLNVLKRLRGLGDRLIVGVSTDEFNAVKGKKPVVPFEQRIEIVRSIKYVDEAIPEENWEQKRLDIQRYGVDVFGIGDDWRGKFDDLGDSVEVVYLPRTEGISTTEMKRVLSAFDERHVDQLKRTLDSISQIVKELS